MTLLRKLFIVLLVITWTPQLALAQIELGGDARVNPDDFDITVFASELNYPIGMAALEDGSILVAMSNGTSFFGSSNGELVRFADTDGDGIADEQTILVESVPVGALTTVRLAGELVFTTGQGRPIYIYRRGDTPTSPYEYIGDINIAYSGSWLHPHSTLAARPTPGTSGSIDLFFQLGSSENFALTTRTLELTSTIGVSGTLVGDAIHRIQIQDDGSTISASEVELIATGLRNATGLIFHPNTGDLFIAENGIDGLVDPNEPHSTDELNILSASDLGNTIQDYGFPSTFEAYRTQEQVGTSGIQPLVSFQPFPDPMTGAESEGPNDIALSPSSFPEGLNNGIFVTFHGKFFLGGVENEENPLVYVDLETLDYFHIISNELPGVGHLDGLLATEDALYIADMSPQGGLGNGTANTGIIYRVTSNQVDTTNTAITDIPTEQFQLDAAVFPNPSRGQINITFESQPGQLFEISIYDLLARKVTSFSGVADAERQHVVWDGNMDNSKQVVGGTYLLSVRHGHRSYSTIFSFLR